MQSFIKIETMKKKILAMALLFSAVGFAQITKNPGDFEKVTSFDRIDVNLVAGSETKVLLSGKDSDQVEVVNNNGELKIRMPIGKLLSGDNVSATVYYKSLTAVEANEGSRIATQETLKAIAFDIIAKEGGQIKVNVEADKLTVKGSQGAILEVAGSAGNQDILVNSGAKYNAEKMITKQTVITVNAGGEASVNATDLVEAKVRAGGNISIYGRPKQVNKKTIAGGTIKEIK